MKSTAMYCTAANLEVGPAYMASYAKLQFVIQSPVVTLVVCGMWQLPLVVGEVMDAVY